MADSTSPIPDPTSSVAELFDNLRKRPYMFVHSVSFETIQSYLRGLSRGMAFAGIEYTWEEYIAAAASRGWDSRGNIGIRKDFVNHALSDEEMVRELIVVETDAYMRALARLRNNAKGI